MNFMSYFILAIIALIAIITVVIIFYKKYPPRTKYSPHTPESKGERGERIVANILEGVILGEQYVLNDLLFYSNSGKSCQIDHIFINKFGIWVIETKNYAGTIYGDEEYRNWTQVLGYGVDKNTFYNPIKQNATHIYHLSQYLKVHNIFYNVVVFLDADISNINSNKLYTVDNLYSIKSRQTSISLSVQQMEYYYHKLVQLKNNSTLTKEEHIQNIHREQAKIEQNICPRCDRELVLRQSKYGAFYGCPNYPKCKFKKDIYS